jgi:hypothetical protein
MDVEILCILEVIQYCCVHTKYWTLGACRGLRAFYVDINQNKIMQIHFMGEDNLKQLYAVSLTRGSVVDSSFPWKPRKNNWGTLVPGLTLNNFKY